MAHETGISWTDSTWNPFYGCHKVSEGCKNCYMYRDFSRWGKNPSVVQRAKTVFDSPLKWKDGRLIFTCSLSDFFIEEADSFRNELWAIIKATPQHTYQILTKRPERIKQCLPADWGRGYNNVWLGISVENESRYAERMALFHSVDAVIKFLSVEPLLSGINFYAGPIGQQIFSKAIDWVIVGGESGNLSGKFTARDCKIQWIDNIIQQCKLSDVPVFVKQLGTILSWDLRLNDKAGAKKEEWPEGLQVQEWPEKYYLDRIEKSYNKSIDDAITRSLS